MPGDQLVLLGIGLALIAAVAVTVAYATSHVSMKGSGAPADDDRAPGLRGLTDDPVDAATTPATSSVRAGSLFVSPASTRQVGRVVAFLFLAAVAVVVALTRAWPENEPAIFTLLAAGTLLVVIFMDMVPPPVMGRWRRPAEGIGAIVFLGLLMALTGGVESPFFIGFFLVVAGSALSTEGLAPLLIALVAAATIALVAAIVSFAAAVDAAGLAWIGFNAVALILLADIATAAARAQRRARDEALRASRFDALTGLYNRSFFFTTMEQEIRRSDRMGRGFTMLMLDLDDLKPVNDNFGHQWGDRLLKAVADVVRNTVRFTDAAARYGGDEFVVLLPETDAAGGFVVGEKLRRDIAALTLHAADRDVRSSVSVGLVTYPADGTTIEQLVAAADVAMYESKRRGKNRIVGYQNRMERVATAIEVDSDELMQLSPAADARTGGDPAPWNRVGSEDAASGAGQPPVEPRAWDTTRRRYDAPGEARATTESRQSRAAPQAEPERAPWDEPPGTTDRSSQPTSTAPPPREGASPAADRDVSTSATEAPWLTRTDAQSSPPRRPETPDDRGRAAGDPPYRPAADASDTPAAAGGGRETSRSEEIRQGGERPWIALPVEPYDPPERPKG